MKQLVPIGTLNEGDAFIIPWRETLQIGRLLYKGIGSAMVKVPDVNGAGMQEINWSLGSEVIPADQEQFFTQFRDEEGKPRNRSAIESPVAVVHRICEKMKGSKRDDIIAACVAEGVNTSTAKTQYYAWRKKM
jgi:hypothetical protein